MRGAALTRARGSMYGRSGITPASTKASRVAWPCFHGYASSSGRPAAARALSCDRIASRFPTPIATPSAARLAIPTISTAIVRQRSSCHARNDGERRDDAVVGAVHQVTNVVPGDADEPLGLDMERFGPLPGRIAISMPIAPLAFPRIS